MVCPQGEGVEPVRTFFGYEGEDQFRADGFYVRPLMLHLSLLNGFKQAANIQEKNPKII